MLGLLPLQQQQEGMRQGASQASANASHRSYRSSSKSNEPYHVDLLHLSVERRLDSHYLRRPPDLPLWRDFGVLPDGQAQHRQHRQQAR